MAIRPSVGPAPPPRPEIHVSCFVRHVKPEYITEYLKGRPALLPPCSVPLSIPPQTRRARVPRGAIPETRFAPAVRTRNRRGSRDNHARFGPLAAVIRRLRPRGLPETPLGVTSLPPLGDCPATGYPILAGGVHVRRVPGAGRGRVLRGWRHGKGGGGSSRGSNCRARIRIRQTVCDHAKKSGRVTPRFCSGGMFFLTPGRSAVRPAGRNRLGRPKNRLSTFVLTNRRPLYLPLYLGAAARGCPRSPTRAGDPRPRSPKAPGIAAVYYVPTTITIPAFLPAGRRSAPAREPQ